MSTNLSFGKELNLYYAILVTLTKKILWEKEKMLVTSIFSFPHIFYPSKYIFGSHLFCRLKMLSVWSVHFLSYGKELSLSQTANLKLKEFADDNFKFVENGRKLSKQVENTVEQGEIARYEQFLLFPQCFQKTCPTNA